MVTFKEDAWKDYCASLSSVMRGTEKCFSSPKSNLQVWGKGVGDGGAQFGRLPKGYTYKSLGT